MFFKPAVNIVEVFMLAFVGIIYTIYDIRDFVNSNEIYAYLTKLNVVFLTLYIHELKCINVGGNVY